MFIFQQLANVSWSYLVRTGVECCDSDQESENDYESIPEQRGFAIPSVPPVLTQPEVLPDTVECVPILISEPALPPGSHPLTPVKCPPCYRHVHRQDLNGLGNHQHICLIMSPNFYQSPLYTQYTCYSFYFALDRDD